jgi:hypothetical protein
MIAQKFEIAWAAFRQVYGDGSLKAVGEFLGGKVKTNVDNAVFTNACAIRMSHVLNTIGFAVPYLPKQTVSGKSGRWFFFRLRDLLAFVRRRIGPPSFSLAPASPSQVADLRALLIFEVAVWDDASGHATLWDGKSCSDHCYFPQAFRLNVWRFK